VIDFSCEAVDDFYIKTDFNIPLEFLQPYINAGEWVDANKLYGNRITDITKGSEEFSNHFILHIEKYDIKLKRLVMGVFKRLGVRTKDFRCDFFLTKKGGCLPEHVDSQSMAAFLVPLNTNTGQLTIRKADREPVSVCYQSAILLNTQLPHSVEAPYSDRLIFRIGIHDQSFEEIIHRMPKPSS
jgi:hypothetical protein